MIKDLFMQKVFVPVAVPVMEFLERPPRAVKTLLRPIANAPWLSKRFQVLVRAYMGATGFEIHEVDVEKGRISIGDVDEVLFGSEIVKILSDVLSRFGEEERIKGLYDIGYEAGYQEAKFALEKGFWAPKVLVPLITSSGLIDRVRADRFMARFFNQVEKMVARIILNEGGWGRVESFDYQSSPIRITLLHSPEVEWLGPADAPVCHIFAGLLAGHASAITGESLSAREVECAAMGGSLCVFEIDR